MPDNVREGYIEWLAACGDDQHARLACLEHLAAARHIPPGEGWPQEAMEIVVWAEARR